MLPYLFRILCMYGRQRQMGFPIRSGMPSVLPSLSVQGSSQAAKEAGNMVDLDNDPTKLIEIVEIGKRLLMTRGIYIGRIHFFQNLTVLF